MFDQVVEERRFPDASLAAQHQHAAVPGIASSLNELI